MKKTYRCTRNKLYAYHDCIGQKNLGARQGHYIEAESEAEAREEMCARFPKDGGDFTITLWEEN